MRLALLLAFVLLPAEAQVLPSLRLVSLLDQYLEITPEQSRRFNENEAEFTRWSFDKIRRVAQVRSEISQETSKPQLDPFAIGVRYVEVEAICRQGREQLDELRRKNVGILNTAQRAKLSVLNEALKLLPVIREAQGRNLLEGEALSPIDSIGGLITGGIGSSSFPLTGCDNPFPGSIIPGIRLPILISSQPRGSVE